MTESMVKSLNVPSGAGCFLTDNKIHSYKIPAVS